MSKVITLRYPARCRICKQTIPAGTRAYWYGKRQGSAHIDCQTPKSENNGSTGSYPAETLHRYAELRQGYLDAYDGNAVKFLTRPTNVSKWTQLERDRNSPGCWAGSTNLEMKTWLNIGYMVPGLEGVDETLIPAAPRRKIKFSEDGDEMVIDLAWAGIDECFIEVEKRYVKPSLRVEINIAFSAFNNARIINAYQSWIARMLQTIDAFGIDMTVDLISPGDRQMVGNEGRHTVRIRVKESGEATDFGNWSPMFSPGGFRQMTFLAIIKSADLAGKDVQQGLGAPRECDGWRVKYDPENNVLSVGNDNRSSEFPEAKMTQDFIEILHGIAHK